MEEIKHIADAVSKGIHVVRIADVQRHRINKGEPDSLVSIDGKVPGAGEYFYAKLDVLVPIPVQP